MDCTELIFLDCVSQSLIRSHCSGGYTWLSQTETALEKYHSYLSTHWWRDKKSALINRNQTQTNTIHYYCLQRNDSLNTQFALIWLRILCRIVVHCDRNVVYCNAGEGRTVPAQTGLCLLFLTQNLLFWQSAESYSYPLNTYTHKNTRCSIWQISVAVYFCKT